MGDTSQLDKVTTNLGLLAPRTLVAVGSGHIFLSQRGVFVFDGQVPRHVSQKMDDFIFTNATAGQLKHATAVFDHRMNTYTLYFAGKDSEKVQVSHNNIGISFDLRTQQVVWQPIITGRNVSTINNYLDDDYRNQIIYGDYYGYLYKDHVGDNDGLGTADGWNIEVASATLSSVTVATSANFTTTDDGLKGHIVRIYEGKGVGQDRLIASNTSASITLARNWSLTPAYWRSKDYSFESEHITKLFKEIDIRFKEQGKFNLDIYYIINFAGIERATLKQVEMHRKAMVWGDSKFGIFGQDRWALLNNVIKRVLLRPTNQQSLYGTHIAFRFGNSRANQEFRIAGFDIVKKDVGRR